jgi:hypothetical protein
VVIQDEILEEIKLHLLNLLGKPALVEYMGMMAGNAYFIPS